MGVLDFINTGLQAGAQVINQINQERQWKREDNAVQRRVADLKAAGLSPVLAAGSAASSSAPIRVEAPRITADVAAQNAGMASTRADTELKKVRYLSELNDIPVSRLAAFLADEKHRLLEGDQTMKDLYLKSAIEREINENEEAVRNIEIYRKYKVPSVGTAGDDIIAGQQMLQLLFPNLDTEKGAGLTVLQRALVPLFQSFIRGRK